MTSIIFINYRRADTANAAGRLYDRLEDHFGADHLFIDVDKIAGGVDFVTELDKKIIETDVLLVLIGANWLTIKDEDSGSRRLDSSADYVRIEIEKALERELEIIPVLVDGADMPRLDDLPESLKPLSRRNAMRLTHERFRADTQGLVNGIEQAIKRVGERREALDLQRQAEAERRKVEEARRDSDDEEERREQARLRATAGLSAEQIGAAEAVANWEFIKESADPQDFRNHLARYTEHEASLMWARRRLDELLWQDIGASPDEPALVAYLNELPKGKYAEEARTQLEDLKTQARDKLAAQKKIEEDEKAFSEKRAKEAAAWEAVKDTTDSETIKIFLQDHPGGAYAVEARRLQRALSGGGLQTSRAKWVVGLMIASVLALAGYFSIPETTRGYWAAERRIGSAGSWGTSLNLSYLNLKELPPELFQLTQLNHLDLSSNDLTKLPPEIGSLTQLTSLDLESNELITLPPEIGKLTGLESLNLRYNKLATLPTEIGSLTKLTSLDVYHNNLTELPPEIGNLGRLTSLDLTFGNLTVLPREIGRLTKLTSLRLGYNGLTALPLEIGSLVELTTLELDGNPWKPPIDALVKEGDGAVLAYLRRQAEATAAGGVVAPNDADSVGGDLPLGGEPSEAFKKIFGGALGDGTVGAEGGDKTAGPLQQFFDEVLKNRKAGTGGGENGTPVRAEGALRGQLGIRLQSITADIGASLGVKENSGVLVASVVPASPAASKGVEKGDIIVSVRGADVSSPDDVVAQLDAARKAGRSAVLLHLKVTNGNSRFVAIPFK